MDCRLHRHLGFILICTKDKFSKTGGYIKMRQKDFARRTLPIIFVLDASSAIYGQSISVLNTYMKDTIEDIGTMATSNYDVIPDIKILQFNTEAHWVNLKELEKARDFTHKTISASGLRNMGAALKELNDKLTRKAFMKSASRGCPAIIIYVLSGSITDDWRGPLSDLQSKNTWYQNSVKLGFAVENDADEKALSNIVGGFGVVFGISEHATFERIFNDIVLSAVNNSWLYYITDDFTGCKNIDNIVSSVVEEFSTNIRDEIIILRGVSNFEEEIVDECEHHQQHKSIQEDIENNISDDLVLKEMMSYSEIWAIINSLEESASSRIPQKVKDFFCEERLKEYEPEIDLNKPLTEQNLQRETMTILAILNVNYWCDDEEEREFYLKEMAENDNTEYDPNDTFWKLSHIFESENKDREIYNGFTEYKRIDDIVSSVIDEGSAGIKNEITISGTSSYEEKIADECNHNQHQSTIQEDTESNVSDNSMLQTMMAFSEIWKILNLLDESYSSLVPQNVRNFFDEERLKDYEPEIDLSRPLTDQNLQRKTVVWLSILNVNYWCESEEERDYLLRQMAENDNKEYDPNDTSWDLSKIFGQDYTTNEKYLKGEGYDHIVLHMPFGEHHLYISDNYLAPRSMFVNSGNGEIAMRFYLDDFGEPVLKITNYSLNNIYVYDSKSRITKFPEGISFFIREKEKILDQDGKIILCITRAHSQIDEEWWDEDW